MRRGRGGRGHKDTIAVAKSISKVRPRAIRAFRSVIDVSTAVLDDPGGPVVSNALIRPSKIARWGNSAAVRIGAAVLEHAHLHVEDLVHVIARDGEIIIRRQRPRVTMAELLSRFDPEKHRRPLELDVAPAGTETR